MATWKKIITSGSAAELSSLTLDTALPVAQGGIGATSLTDKAVLISQDSGTDAVGALALNTNGNIIVGGTNGPAVEAASDVAGDGLDASVGDGTLAINVAAAQTTITSILATDIKIGEDDETKIDFEDDNKINFYANNNKEVELAENSLSPGSSDGTALGTTSLMWSDLFLANGGVINFNNGNASITHAAGRLTVSGHLAGTVISGSTISASAFVGDGSGLTGLTAAAIETYTNNGNNRIITSVNSTTVNGEANLTFDGTNLLIAGGGEVQFRDAGDEKIYSVSDGTLGIEAGTEVDITATNIDINGAVDISGNTVIGGDLTVNGTTTTVATTNTKVEDKFMFLATGSAGTNTDAGIMVQSGSVDLSGSAFYHDINVVTKTNPNGGRWSVAKSVGHDVGAVTPLQFVTTVKTDTVNPSSESGSYGAGEMHVNTDSGDIWIRFE